MKHWLENALGLPGNTDNEEQIIVLMDPDMIILKPFAQNNFSHAEWDDDVLFLNGRKTRNKKKVEVTHGVPMAQRYGFELRWMDFARKTNISDIIDPATSASKSSSSSPVMSLSDDWGNYVVRLLRCTRTRD